MRRPRKNSFRWRQAFKDERGFSLAEVVLAVALLAVAAVLVGRLMTVSVQTHQTSERGEQAVHIALREAERLKSISYNDLASAPEEDAPGYPGFRVKVDVEEVNSYTKRVTVRVTYPEQGGGRGEQRLVFEKVRDL